MSLSASVIPHTSSIAGFLKNAKLHLKALRAGSGASSTKHIVIGNEACDADSIISSLCYSYLKDRNANGTDGCLYLPVAPIARSDLLFRREVQLLMNSVNMNIEDLICAEEVPFDDLYKESTLELTLTDHNSLGSSLADYSTCVREIVDHHMDVGAHKQVIDDRRNIAFDPESGKALAGSACTLVAEKYFESAESELLSEDVATLLMGVIALDTINMSKSAGIGTERDQAAIDRLQMISKQPLDSLFVSLRDAKLDPTFWSELSASDALRIDYKRFPIEGMMPGAAVGISSILEPIPAFLGKSKLFESMEEYIKGQDIVALVVMSFCPVPAPQRQLFVLTPNKTLAEALHSFCLTGNETHNLDLTSMQQQHLTTGSSVGSSVGTGTSIDTSTSSSSGREFISNASLLGVRFLDVDGDGPLPTAGDAAAAAGKNTAATGTAAGTDIDIDIAPTSRSGTQLELYAAAYHQGNEKASRKQVAPQFVQYLQNYASCL